MRPTLTRHDDADDRPVLACFTEDMAENLLRFFHHYQRDGVVALQLTEGGRLWLVNPHDDSRQFLGQAVLTDEQKLRIEEKRRGMN